MMVVVTVSAVHFRLHMLMPGRSRMRIMHIRLHFIYLRQSDAVDYPLFLYIIQQVTANPYRYESLLMGRVFANIVEGFCSGECRNWQTGQT